jgi:putative tryptophan/tyrosine transport system substrate-binding protein
MRRREFITLLGGVAATWPLTVHGQQSAMPVIGFLSAGIFEKNRDYVAAFHRALADGGFTEGRNVGIEYRWSENHNDRLPALAADLARRQVAVIFAASTPASLAAKAATQTIPIVFAVGTDPVEIGLVATLARPGGNITGVTNLNVELFKKCFELMHSLMSAASTIAVLVNPANIAQTATERATIQDAARALGVRLVILDASSPSEIESTFEVLVGQHVDALVVSGEIFFLTQRDRLVELAARHAVPTIYAYREFPVAGGLMSYGADFKEPYRLGGVYAVRILKGEKPANLPVQQTTKVELVVNQKTAKALEISVPQALISRADEVIE